MKRNGVEPRFSPFRWEASSPRDNELLVGAREEALRSSLNKALRGLPGLRLIDALLFPGPKGSPLVNPLLKGGFSIGMVGYERELELRSAIIKLAPLLDLPIFVKDLRPFQSTFGEKPLKGFLQAIFEAPSTVKQFKAALSAGNLGLASFGEACSRFRAEEAVRNALRKMVNVDFRSANGAILHVRASKLMFEDEVSRAIELLQDLLRGGPVCCSVKLGVDPPLKAFLVLIHRVEALRFDEEPLRQIFNMEPEALTEEKLNLNLDLASID